MNYEKFKDILFKNKMNESYVKQKLIEFSNRSNYNPNDNITKLVHHFGSSVDIFVFRLPIKKTEIEAFHFEDDSIKILILNSNIPRKNMNFTFVHEIFHILDGSRNTFAERNQELILADSYYEDQTRIKASLFASKLLMPEVQFKKIFNLYKKKCDGMKDVIFQLMYYFEVPYLSVLFRLYDLELLKDLILAKDLLQIDTHEISCYFDTLYLDKTMIEPSRIDESKLILKEITEKGSVLISERLISKKNLEEKVKNCKQLLSNFIGEINVEY